MLSKVGHRILTPSSAGDAMKESEWLNQARQLYNERNGTDLPLDELLANSPSTLFKPKKSKAKKRSKAEWREAAKETRRSSRMEKQADAIALVKEWYGDGSHAMTDFDGLVVLLNEKKIKAHQDKRFNRERVRALLKDIGLIGRKKRKSKSELTPEYIEECFNRVMHNE
jgi:hypothetical protein